MWNGVPDLHQGNVLWDFVPQKKMFSAGGPGIELLLVAWFAR
jgi:hypothetical protein